jgi:hypothetical protein
LGLLVFACADRCFGEILCERQLVDNQRLLFAGTSGRTLTGSAIDDGIGNAGQLAQSESAVAAECDLAGSIRSRNLSELEFLTALSALGAETTRVDGASINWNSNAFDAANDEVPTVKATVSLNSDSTVAVSAAPNQYVEVATVDVDARNGGVKLARIDTNHVHFNDDGHAMPIDAAGDTIAAYDTFAPTGLSW